MKNYTNADDFDLSCVPMCGTLAALRDLVTYGDRVRVAPTKHEHDYWGVLRLAQGCERQPTTDEGVFWMTVEPGQWFNGALIHRRHLDAVDLTNSPSAKVAVLSLMEKRTGHTVNESDLLSVLKEIDRPSARWGWRRPYQVTHKETQ